MNAARTFFAMAAISLVSTGLALIGPGFSAQAQTVQPKAEPSMKMPSPQEGAGPANSGIVTPPPSTGTESKTIRVPSQQVDPAIARPTDNIDRQNQEKSRKLQENK